MISWTPWPGTSGLHVVCSVSVEGGFGLSVWVRNYTCPYLVGPVRPQTIWTGVVWALGRAAAAGVV